MVEMGWELKEKKKINKRRRERERERGCGARREGRGERRRRGKIPENNRPHKVKYYFERKETG